MLIGALAGLSSCGGAPTAPSAAELFTAWAVGLRVNGPRGVLAPGETVQLQAATTDSFGGFLQNCTGESAWASSAPQVTTVSSSGVVTAVAAGTTEITATYRSLTGASVLRVVEPNGRVAGRIDPAVAADIVAYNQEVLKTNQWRQTGIITLGNCPYRSMSIQAWIGQR